MLIAPRTALREGFPSRDFLTPQRGGTLTSSRRATCVARRPALCFRCSSELVRVSFMARFLLLFPKSGWVRFARVKPGRLGENQAVGDGAVASGDPLLTSPPPGRCGFLRVGAGGADARSRHGSPGLRVVCCPGLAHRGAAGLLPTLGIWAGFTALQRARWLPLSFTLATN